MKILCAIIVIFSMLPNALAEETLNEQEQQDEFQLILKKSVDINKQNIDSLNNAKKNVDRIIEYHKALNANQKKLNNLKKKYYESDANFSLDRPLSYFIPNADTFMRSCSAVYEYLGLLWYSVRA